MVVTHLVYCKHDSVCRRPWCHVVPMASGQTRHPQRRRLEIAGVLSLQKPVRGCGVQIPHRGVFGQQMKVLDIKLSRLGAA